MDMVRKLTNEEMLSLQKLVEQFPREILVKTSFAEEGGFNAEILVNNETLYTSADSISELIGMINDAVRTYFEVGEKLVPFMPEYIPPTSVMQQLGFLPQFTAIPRFEPAQH